MTTFTLSTVGGIIVAVFLFIILKRVVGLIFRIILAGVLIVAVMLGAWWWSSSKSVDSTGNSNARPRRTPRTQTQ